jgi:hypothetical protein
MQSQNGPTPQAMRNPSYALAFVHHALEPPRPRINPSDQAKSRTLSLGDLRIVPETRGEDSDDEDSEDNASDDGQPLDEEMTTTAIQLLLSVLEGALTSSTGLKN